MANISVTINHHLGMVKHRPPLRSKAWFFQAAARHSRHYCLLPGYGSDMREFTLLIIRTAVGLYREIGHFRVPKILSFKTRLSENKFCMRIKNILISMALHLASLWNRGLGQLWNGLLYTLRHTGGSTTRNASVAVNSYSALLIWISVRQ